MAALTGGLRVDEEQEQQGLDIIDHDEKAIPCECELTRSKTAATAAVFDYGGQRQSPAFSQGRNRIHQLIAIKIQKMRRHQTGCATVIDKLTAQSECRAQNRREIVYAHINGCRPLERILFIKQRSAGINGDHIHVSAGKAAEQLIAWIQQMLWQMRLDLYQSAFFSQYFPTSRLNQITRVMTGFQKNGRSCLIVM